MIELADHGWVTSPKGNGGSILHHSRAQWSRSHKDIGYHLKWSRKVTYGINPMDIGSFERWFNVGEILREEGPRPNEVPKEKEKRMGREMKNLF